jgi:hypothetical protein
MYTDSLDPSVVLSWPHMAVQTSPTVDIPSSLWWRSWLMFHRLLTFAFLSCFQLKRRHNVRRRLRSLH